MKSLYKNVIFTAEDAPPASGNDTTTIVRLEVYAAYHILRATDYQTTRRYSIEAEN
ncbi:MAG: hypothetical protein Q9172_002131 [Xanthocarpia lactea]